MNYRGYTASPLLGTPEGISVYMDGVRQNQPFGDIVAWDLIPKIAISEVALMPGSNPLFGLNTLGGAVSIETKDGHSAPGISLSVNGGSFGRRAGEVEYGGSNSKGLSWYVAGNLFREDGWREHSPSEVRQAFGKLGWMHGKTSISLSFGYADNWLTGNGLQDFRFLEQDYRSVYSIPDITWNRSPSFNLSVRHSVTSNLTFSGNAYFRYIRADTTNGDINSQSFDADRYTISAPADIAALTAAGYSGFPTTGNAATEPFPYWRCIAQGLELNQPIEKCTGIITNTFTKQHNYGLSGQARWLVAHNHLTAGAAWDRSSMTFQQGSQFGYLNPDRHHDHSDQCVRGRQHQSGWRPGGHARELAWAHQHLQPVCDGHDHGRQDPGVHVFRAATTARPSTTSTACRQPRWQACAALSTVNMFSSGSIRPPASLTARPASPACISATAKPAARPRRSNWAAPIPTSRAICRTRWSAILR